MSSRGAALTLLLATLVFAAAATRVEPLPPDRELEPGPAWLLPFDDAYIFIRFAQQAARGRPLQWSPEKPSSGASSFLHPWLLLPGQWLAADLEGWSLWSRAVGLAALWLLGLAAWSLLRRWGLPRPWALAGALLVVWSGPVGWASLGGMESALNAAALLGVCALWSPPAASSPGREDGRKARRESAWLILLLCLLPLLRPENLALTLVAALAVALGRVPGAPRRTAPLVLLPAATVTLLHWSLTGLAQPTGAVVKSITATPFASAALLARLHLLGTIHKLAPVYAGAHPELLPPPVGLAALATVAVVLLAAPRPRRKRVPATWSKAPATWSGSDGEPTPPIPWGHADAGRQRLSAMAPAAVAWLILAVLAPFSGVILWQAMRHHHGGLVLAWVLATAGLATAVEAARRRWRMGGHALPRAAGWLPLLLPLLLLPRLPYWASTHAAVAADLHARHGAAAEWLRRNRGQGTLLVNDAGLLSLAHDGPAVDAMGLGTPALAHPFRHGPGALAEALGRQDPLPQLAAVNLDVFPLPQLLGEPLLPRPAARGHTRLARVRAELLADTALPGAGLDFAHLADEGLREVEWSPPPSPQAPSHALLLAGPDGGSVLQGCRPLPGAVILSLPGEAGPWALRLAAPPTAGVSLRVLAGGGLLAEGRFGPGSWGDVTIPPRARGRVTVVRGEGGVPCLESLRPAGGD